MKKNFLILMSLLCLSITSHGLIEIRAGLNTQTGSPKDYNDYIDEECVGCGTKADKMAGLGFDVVAKIPLIPFGFGIRYDNMKQSVEVPGVAKLTQDFKATSLLLNYRFWDTLAYVGPIFTYGLSNQSTLDLEVTANPSQNFSGKAGKATAYTAGIEGGLKLGLLRLGAEAGYGSFIAQDIKDSAGAPLVATTKSAEKIDLTGPYFRIQLGVGF